MKYITKQDYLKLGKRQNVHTHIREDLYLGISIQSKILQEPIGKILDILLLDILDNAEKQKELKVKLQKYR